MQEISRYNKSQLRAFLDSEEFATTPVLPISRQRALSYLANPRAEEEDTFMYVARQDQQIVAYRLVLPDLLYIGEEARKIAWFSCIYVTPGLRGSGIAKKLTALAMEDWGSQIIYNDPVTASGQLYIGTGQFEPYPGTDGLKAYLRASFRDIMKARRKLPFIIDVLLNISDFIFNTINSLNIYKWGKKIARSVEGKYEYLEKIDPEAGSFLEKYLPKEFNRRGRTELNWILQYPWIIQSAGDEYGERYHFSAFEKEFKYYLIKIIGDNKSTKGLLMLSLKNGHMKVPYCYAEEDVVPLITHIIYHHLLITGASTLTVFNKQVVSCIRSRRHPFWLIRNKNRPLFVAKHLRDDMLNAGKHFQDGDGDNVFT